MTVSAKKLITNGLVLAGDPGDARIGITDILVDGDRIAAIGDDLDPEGAEIIDATGMLIIPGLVDTHKHTWQSAVRHRCTDIDLNTYFGEMFATRGPRYTPEDVFVGTLLGAVAALDAGTTTLMDWSHIQNSPAHSDRAIDALETSGLRAIFGHGWPCVDLLAWIANSELPHTDDVRRIRAERLADDHALVTLALAGRGPELSTIAVSRADIEMARELGIRTSIHMGCGRDRGAQAAIAQLAAEGLLGPDLSFVHCSESSDSELDLMLEHGVTASIAPQHEFAFGGIGYSPIERLRARGISTGLSTDTETAGASDMFVQMRAAIAADRSIINETRTETWAPTDMTAAEVFRMATAGGAESLGIGHRTGSLVVGYQADIVFIRANDINLYPVTNPVAAVVAGAHPGNVDSVMVAGRFRKRHGALLDIDLDQLRALALESHDRILSEETS